jgi:2-polyprenyl-6-hydroxyphenyl methylase / 3-demethylubiquinone-9 3-methyltransferase
MKLASIQRWRLYLCPRRHGSKSCYFSSSTARNTTSSVSSTEVEKFSNLSHSWWDPKQNPLISMNAIRIEYIKQQMEKAAVQRQQRETSIDKASSSPMQPPLHGLKALDVGCGGGLLSESLARLGAHVTAIDPSHELVQHAKQHAQLHPQTSTINYQGGCTVEQLALQVKEQPSDDNNDALFDIICLLEVIEHVTDVESILQATTSLLKPHTGRLFLSTLNRTIKSHLIAIVGAEYIMRDLPPGTHNWHQFQSPQELHHKLPPLGLQPLHTSGMVMTSLPPHWNWKLDSNDTDINWIGTYQRIK